jgi:hypothetical protein
VALSFGEVFVDEVVFSQGCVGVGKLGVSDDYMLQRHDNMNKDLLFQLRADESDESVPVASSPLKVVSVVSAIPPGDHHVLRADESTPASSAVKRRGYRGGRKVKKRISSVVSPLPTSVQDHALVADETIPNDPTQLRRSICIRDQRLRAEASSYIKVVPPSPPSPFVVQSPSSGSEPMHENHPRCVKLPWWYNETGFNLLGLTVTRGYESMMSRITQKN